MISKDLLNLISKGTKKEKGKKTGLAIAFVMGAVAAATAVGILFAPQAGKKTRKDLKKKTDDTVEAIKETFQKREDATKDSVDRTEQEVRNVIKEVQEKAEGVKKDIKDGSDKIIKDVSKTLK